jgi:hypothetical protein
MAELTPSQIRVRDPLSEVTRNERRFLLGASIIAITIVRTGLVPSRISALGIEFSQTDQKSLLLVLALVTSYFVVAFALYATSDFIAWRLAFLASIRELVEQERKRRVEPATQSHRPRLERAEGYYRRSVKGFRYVSIISGPTSFLRALFEFVLPLVVGVYAAVLLLKTPPPLQEEHKNTSIIVLPHSAIPIDSDAPVHLFP